MAKNIVVLKLYKMPDRTEQNFKFKFDSDTYHTYKKLLDLAVTQAEQHIQDTDELIVHERTADNDQDMFKKHMLELEELYKSGDHNVLSIGNDVIYFESTNPFDPAYSRFTLSGLNADVKYFPAGGVSDDPEVLLFWDWFLVSVIIKSMVKSSSLPFWQRRLEL